MKKNNQNSAFSVVEISISILIIGVLIAAIVKAGALVKESKQMARRLKIQGQGPEIPDALFTKNNQLWFDAANINGKFNYRIQDGQKIKTWENIINPEYLAVQANSDKQPTYYALEKGIKFDGIDDYLPIKEKSYFTTELANINVFVVAKSSSTSGQIMISFDRSDYYRFSLIDDQVSGQIAFDTTDRNGINDFGGGVYTNGVAHIFHAQYEKDKQPYNKIIYVDGVAKRQGTAHGRDPLGYGARKRYGLIGVGSEAGSFDGGIAPSLYMNGNIYEIIVIEDILSKDEISEINHYLAKKWKLTNTVDSDNDGLFDSQDPKPITPN